LTGEGGDLEQAAGDAGLGGCVEAEDVSDIW